MDVRRTGIVPHTVLLVEGISDSVALETLAARRGRNLDAEGISIVPIGVRRQSAGFSIATARGG